MHIQFFIFLFTAIFLITPSLPSWAMESEDKGVRTNPSSVSSQPFFSHIKPWEMEKEESIFWKNDGFNAFPVTPPPDGLSVRLNIAESLFTTNQERLLRSLGINPDGRDDPQSLSSIPASTPTPEEERTTTPILTSNSEYMNHSADPFFRYLKHCL